MPNRIGPRLIWTAGVASALAAILFVAACSDDEAISERSTPIPSPMVQVAITPSPVTIIDTATPTATPTISENPWERCMGAANLVPLPESRSQNQSTPDPLELLRQSVDAMSELESFAATTVLLETFEDRSEDFRELQKPKCLLAEDKYENPGRAATRRTRFEVETLSYVSQYERLWIGQSAYSREDDDRLWQPLDYDFTLTPEIFLPFVMVFLLNEELASEIQTELRVVGAELLDGVEVYHVQEEVTGWPPSEFRNVASFWIGVDDQLLRRAHWAHAGTVNYHQPYLITFSNELIEFHSFNEDFNIQLPPDDEIALP